MASSAARHRSVRSGVWKDLTESVNSMASNLTAQVLKRRDNGLVYPSSG
jgi:hypothetical protein